MTDPILLTVKEACLLLRCSESWLRTSNVPRLRIGRFVRFVRADLEAWVSNHRRAA